MAMLSVRRPALARRQSRRWWLWQGSGRVDSASAHVAFAIQAISAAVGMHDSESTHDGADQGRGGCHSCWQHHRCLPAELTGAALAAFERSVIAINPLPAGQTLVKAGTPIEALYALRRGALKSSYRHTDGDNQLLEFHFPGSVLGITEDARPVWGSTYTALVDSWVCHIPLHVLDHGLQRRMARLVSARLRHLYAFRASLAQRSPSQRLAMLLIRLGERLQSDDASVTRFRLPMTHSDLARYLDMRADSLSRSFRNLSLCGWITRRGRDEIVILDLAGLRRFSGG